MGMYVGFSFLSLFELIEVFIRRFWYLISRKRLSFRTVAKHVVDIIQASKIRTKVGPDIEKFSPYHHMK